MTARDHDEIELKFRLENVGAGERMLAARSLGGLVGTGPVSVVRVEDRYIDTPGSALRAAGYAVRLRARGTEVTVSLKSLARREGNGRVHRRREVEGPATPSLDPASWPPSNARTLLMALRGDTGLEDLVTIRQVRRQRIFAGDLASIEVSIDEVQIVSNDQIVGRFVEAEAELVAGNPTALVAVGNDLAAMPGASEATTSKFEAALSAIGRDPMMAEPLAETADMPVADVEVAPADEIQGAPVHETQAAPVPADEAEVEPDVEPEVALPPAPDPEPAVRAAPPSPRGKRRDPGEPKSPGVRPDDSVAEAGRKVLAFHFARMMAREPGTREGDAVELHQMRVATRRMRAAWRVFGDGFDARTTRKPRARLRRVAQLLGGVRDLDVLLEGADAYRMERSASDQRGLDPLLERWRHQREISRRALARELEGEPYRRWAIAYADLVGSVGQAARTFAPTEPQRIRDTAPTGIWAAFARVRAYEPILRFADVPTLHELRITAKWLRYTLEFHADALGPDVAPLIARVTALQDHLGLLHDADVAADLVRAFLLERAAGLDDVERAAIGRYLAEREAEVERLRGGVSATWRGVAGLTFRRRLGRLVAGL